MKDAKGAYQEQKPRCASSGKSLFAFQNGHTHRPSGGWFLPHALVEELGIIKASFRESFKT
jgi:hypothetical protein